MTQLDEFEDEWSAYVDERLERLRYLGDQWAHGVWLPQSEWSEFVELWRSTPNLLASFVPSGGSGGVV